MIKHAYKLGLEADVQTCFITKLELQDGKLKIANKHKDAQGHALASPNRAEALMLAASPQRLTRGVIEVPVMWG